MRNASTDVQRIVVGIVEHKHTHLLVAYSKDLPGLTVAARARDQLFREIPGAIKEMLEAAGKTGVSVEAEEDTLPRNFSRNTMIANARFEQA